MKKTLIQRSSVEREIILNATRQHLAADPRVLFAYAHGSFLENRPIHDLDVAVYLDSEDKGEMHRFARDLAASLEQAISPVVRLPVDVRVLNRAPLGFRYHAFCGKLLFSRDEDLRTRLVERTMSRYLDLKPLQQRALKEAMATWI